MITKFLNNQLAPINNSTLVLFRIAFGLVVFAEGAGALALGWVHETFVEPEFLFTFIDFDWLLHLKGPWMYFHYALIAVFGLFIAFGLFYKISTLGFFLFWTAAYLMQKQHYNNHYYLMVILGFLMMLVPAHKRLSLDSRWGFTKKENHCPAWSVNIFILQLAIVYFYASIAKLYPDWLAGKPLTIWLGYISQDHIFGSFLANPVFIKIVAYSGIIFDLLVVPLLLYKKTRWIAVIASVIFHLFNSIVFQIGTFPYLMLGSLILFFPPEEVNNKFFKEKSLIPRQEIQTYESSPYLVSLIVLFFIVQIGLPIRHHFFEGNVNWNEEGHRLSWRMMLRTKSGSIYFKVIDPKTGKEWLVDPEKEGITSRQERAMSKSPDMIWQYTQFLKKRFADKGFQNVEIYAFSQVSLNGRSHYPFTNPKVNLSEVEWSDFSHNDWIFPLPDDFKDKEEE